MIYIITTSYLRTSFFYEDCKWNVVGETLPRHHREEKGFQSPTPLKEAINTQGADRLGRRSQRAHRVAAFALGTSRRDQPRRGGKPD